MRRLTLATGAGLVGFLGTHAVAWAAGAVDGAVDKQGLNIAAIGMFFLFVVGTLFITYRAAASTKSAADFYAAGGGITGFQNGLAIAGDYMSAASFLGISGLIALVGYDGMLYSVGFLVAWLVVLFLVAELVRNCGRFTLADVVAARMRERPVRIALRSGRPTTVET